MFASVLNWAISIPAMLGKYVLSTYNVAMRNTPTKIATRREGQTFITPPPDHPQNFHDPHPLRGGETFCALTPPPPPPDLTSPPPPPAR